MRFNEKIVSLKVIAMTVCFLLPSKLPAQYANYGARLKQMQKKQISHMLSGTWKLSCMSAAKNGEIFQKKIEASHDCPLKFVFNNDSVYSESIESETFGKRPDNRRLFPIGTTYSFGVDHRCTIQFYIPNQHDDHCQVLDRYLYLFENDELILIRDRKATDEFPSSTDLIEGEKVDRIAFHFVKDREIRLNSRLIEEQRTAKIDKLSRAIAGEWSLVSITKAKEGKVLQRFVDFSKESPSILSFSKTGECAACSFSTQLTIRNHDIGVFQHEKLQYLFGDYPEKQMQIFTNAATKRLETAKCRFMYELSDDSLVLFHDFASPDQYPKNMSLIQDESINRVMLHFKRRVLVEKDVVVVDNLKRDQYESVLKSMSGKWIFSHVEVANDGQRFRTYPDKESGESLTLCFSDSNATSVTNINFSDKSVAAFEIAPIGSTYKLDENHLCHLEFTIPDTLANDKSRIVRYLYVLRDDVLVLICDEFFPSEYPKSADLIKGESFGRQAFYFTKVKE